MNKKKETRIKFIKKARDKALITKIIYVFLIIFVVLNVIFLVNTTIKKLDYFNLMGISLFSMKTNLMGDEIPKNSLVITKQYDNDDKIEINDNIAYIVNGKIKISKVVQKDVIDGKLIYKTKLNENYYIDNQEISKNQIIGKTITIIPFLGVLLGILQSKITTVVIIFILIIKFIYNKKIYKRRIKRTETLRNKP